MDSGRNANEIQISGRK